ncbi:MAG: hypothetical protein Q7U35_02270 [Methanobacteriaceae archaeon]|nr:hypothetical protein [Methanobacteriaceae archaeon]MDP2837183.1 hypothetical protein [Methanobacteriaceae archaeon]MDP3035942.1 hypothetical protein [Methanobacteriaceae archaeon]MDP3486027.1 hypothetical protein [Methanobacteriaceae archaeon]MDP3622914.1 hypothetical protein [Methanobacteriaceae archaeon]
MSILEIINLIVFITVMVCILGAMGIFITYNKEEMQARFFLKYAQIRKGAISFLLGVAIFVITYSSNEVGIISATGYLFYLNILILLLVLISFYYFFTTVQQKTLD